MKERLKLFINSYDDLIVAGANKSNTPWRLAHIMQPLEVEFLTSLKSVTHVDAFAKSKVSKDSLWTSTMELQLSFFGNSSS